MSAVAIVSTAFWIWGFGTLLLGQDAITYLAAAERLNVGHSLYGPLQSGDRPVLFGPPYWTTPLVSPPLIAVIWRPFASSIGLGAWMLLDAIAVAIVCGYVLLKRAPLVLLLGSVGVGLQVAEGNVAGFLVGGIVLLWTKRERPWVGALLGVMVATKLLPIAFIGFGARRRGSWAWFIAGLFACSVISLAGAGLENHLAYPAVLRGLVPYPASLGAWTGIPWLGYAALVVGIVAGYALPERGAYLAALASFVLAAPGLGLWSLVYVLPIACPMATRELRFRRFSIAGPVHRTRSAAVGPPIRHVSL